MNKRKTLPRSLHRDTEMFSTSKSCVSRIAFNSMNVPFICVRKCTLALLVHPHHHFWWEIRKIKVIRCPPNSAVQGGKQTNKETKNSNWKHILKKESNINEKSGSCLESTGSCCTHHKWHFFLFFLEWDIFHWWLIQCRRHNIRKTTGFWKLRQNFSSKRYSNGKN